MAASTVDGAAVDAPDVAIIPVNIESVTQPVAETSRRLYEKVAGGAQWYVEQWEDLVVEAKHVALGGNAHVTQAEVLAGLASAKVASDIPGRLRVRLNELRWQDHLAMQCSQALGSLPGITEVEVSSVSGSILVFYDTTRYATRAALMDALAAA